MSNDPVILFLALTGAITSACAGLGIVCWLLSKALQLTWRNLITLYDLHTLGRAARQIGKRLPWGGED